METRPRIIIIEGRGRRTDRLERKQLRLMVVSAIALGLGFASPLAGLAIIIIHTLIPGDTLLNTIGSLLMIASIPLLLLGSHLLDVLERSR